MVHAVRRRMIALAERIYPTNFYDWKVWYKEILIEEYDVFPTCLIGFEGTSPHPNSVLNLFRKCHVMKCLPMAFHDVCAEGTRPIFDQGDTITLSPDDLRAAVLGAEYLKNTTYKIRDSLLCQLVPIDGCLAAGCEAAFSKQAKLEFASSTIFEGGFLSPLKPFSAQLKEICDHCFVMVSNMEDQIQTKLWESLPAKFELAP